MDSHCNERNYKSFVCFRLLKVYIFWLLFLILFALPVNKLKLKVVPPNCISIQDGTLKSIHSFRFYSSIYIVVLISFLLKHKQDTLNFLMKRKKNFTGNRNDESPLFSCLEKRETFKSFLLLSNRNVFLIIYNV